MNPLWDSRFEELVRRHVDLASDAVMRVDTDLPGHGLDSIAIVELVVSLEDTYGIEIQDEKLTQQTFATPGVLWSVVSELQERIPSKGGTA